MREGGWNFGIPAKKPKVTAATNNTSVDLSTKVFPPRKRNYHLGTGNSINHHDPEAHLRGREISPSFRLSWALCRSSAEESEGARGKCSCKMGCPRCARHRQFSWVLTGRVCNMQEVELLKANTTFVPNTPSKHIVNTKPGEEMEGTAVSAWGIRFKVDNKEVQWYFRMTMFFSHSKNNTKPKPKNPTNWSATVTSSPKGQSVAGRQAQGAVIRKPALILNTLPSSLSQTLLLQLPRPSQAAEY